MKLSQNELKELASQLRCPDGEEGLKVGKMMNLTNRNIITKTIKSLNLKYNDSVLEIGPGNGNHVNEIIAIANNINYFGIDISEAMVWEAENLNKNFDNVSFRLSDGEHIPFSEDHFDVIFTCNTIYFWNDSQDYLNEISRVLKNNGRVSIGFIPKSTMQKIPFAKYGFTLYTTEAVISLMENSGLTITSATTETEMIISNSGNQIEREFVVVTAEKDNTK